MSKRNLGPTNPHRLSRVKREMLRRKSNKQARRARRSNAAHNARRAERYVRRLQLFAKLYLRRGLQVLALRGIVNGACSCGNPNCTCPGKHPIQKGGVHSASNDLDVVLGWVERYGPRMNLGIATGNDCVVIDSDPRNEGDESLPALEEELGELSRAWLAHTGGGGVHVYGAAPSAQIRTSHGKLAKGIDVQAEAGYVVAPPSRHISGGQYSWDKQGPFRTREIPRPWPVNQQGLAHQAGYDAARVGGRRRR